MGGKRKICAALAAGVLIAAAAPAYTAGLAPIRARAASYMAVQASPRLVLAHLDEQTLPAAESPGNAPAEALPPGAARGDWERLPNPTAAATPGAESGAAQTGAVSVAPAPGALPPAPSASPSDAASAVLPPVPAATDDAATDATDSRSNPPSGSAAAAQSPEIANPENPATDAAGAGAASPPNAPAVAGAAPPGAGPTSNPGEPPPALDISTVTAGPDLGNLPLDDEIRQADTPALAASLRITEQARNQLNNGATDPAMRALARAVSIDPGNPYAYFFLGRAYVARHDYAQALTFFRRAEIGFGANPQWLGETIGYEGACEEELGQLSQAAVAYQRALAAAPNNLMARVGYDRLAANLPNPAGLDAPPPSAGDASGPPSADLSAPEPEEAPPPPPPPSAGANSENQ